MHRVPEVRTLTRNAGHDDLTADDYREIYQEMRQHDAETDRYGISLDAFVELIASEFSKALWSKYHTGKSDLNRTMRNELRTAVGLPPLPPTVTDVTAAVDVNAHIVQIGDHRLVDRVILASTAGDPIVISLNGEIRIVSPAPSPELDEPGEGPAADEPVTPVTRRQRGRISLPQAQFDRLNAKRQEIGMTWPEFLQKLEGIDA